jgi:hypothetical protein
VSCVPFVVQEPQIYEPRIARSPRIPRATTQDSGAGQAQETRQDASIDILLLATRPLRGFAASRLCFPGLSLTGPEKVTDGVLTPASLKTQRRQDQQAWGKGIGSSPFASLRLCVSPFVSFVLFVVQKPQIYEPRMARSPRIPCATTQPIISPRDTQRAPDESSCPGKPEGCPGTR